MLQTKARPPCRPSFVSAAPPAVGGRPAIISLRQTVRLSGFLVGLTIFLGEGGSSSVLLDGTDNSALLSGGVQDMRVLNYINLSLNIGPIHFFMLLLLKMVS